MREIDNTLAFDQWINNGAIEHCAIQGVDVRPYDAKISRLDFSGSLFLGCPMNNEAAGHIAKTGGMVIANQDDLLFTVHRATLYSVDELYKGFDINSDNSYHHTYDYKVYEEYVRNGMENPQSIRISLMRRLHDHSMTDALQEIIAGRKVVAIMGGHSMERSDKYYTQVATIARTLTRQGFLMVTGGGPGAMEATHLGAYFAGRPDSDMIHAINDMKKRPPNAPANQEYADPDWLQRAWKVRLKYPIPAGKEEVSMSVGIPTWLYGHEPPAAFATHIAKYFANSVREDGLLTIAKYGVIFAPGSAGTTQEIFQDATQNHYAPYNTTDTKKYVSPMILFGVKRWTVERPLWDFIRSVSEGRPYGKLLYLTEDENEVINAINAYNPTDYGYPKDTNLV